MSSCQPRREAGQGFALYTSCDIGAEWFLRAWGLIVAGVALAEARMISIIDYGPYFAGARGALEGIAVDVARACENVGFFYALNHGVSDDTIDRAFAASRRCPALPLEQKLALRLDDNNMGYLAINASIQGASAVHKQPGCPACVPA